MYSLENEFIPIYIAKIVFMLFKPPNSFFQFSHDGADPVQPFRWPDNRVGPISGWPDNWTGTVPMVQSAEDKYMSAGLSDHFTP